MRYAGTTVQRWNPRSIRLTVGPLSACLEQLYGVRDERGIWALHGFDSALSLSVFESLLIWPNRSCTTAKFRINR